MGHSSEKVPYYREKGPGVQGKGGQNTLRLEVVLYLLSYRLRILVGNRSGPSPKSIFLPGRQTHNCRVLKSLLVWFQYLRKISGDGPNTTTIFPKSFASDAIPKTAFDGTSDEKIILVSLCSTVWKGHLVRHPGVPQKCKMGPREMNSTWLWSWLGRRLRFAVVFFAGTGQPGNTYRNLGGITGKQTLTARSNRCALTYRIDSGSKY